MFLIQNARKNKNKNKTTFEIKSSKELFSDDIILISFISNWYTRVIEFLRIFEFHNLHLMRVKLMLPDSISEEKLKID